MPRHYCLELPANEHLGRLEWRSWRLSISWQALQSAEKSTPHCFTPSLKILGHPRRVAFSTTKLLHLCQVLIKTYNTTFTDMDSNQAFENTSTSVAASQMRNALNALADSVKDASEKQVSFSHPRNCASFADALANRGSKLKWITSLPSSDVF